MGGAKRYPSKPAVAMGFASLYPSYASFGDLPVGQSHSASHMHVCRGVLSFTTCGRTEEECDDIAPSSLTGGPSAISAFSRENFIATMRRYRIRKNKMDLGLKGRNAVVLGGTRGIGRAIADTLAGEGAGVAVCARNADQVAGTVAELQAKGVKATGAPLDITDAAALKSWIADVARELGSVDLLFSNAGAMAQGGDPASWEQNFRLDVLGAVHAFDAAKPFLEASGERSGDAAFVIISSISAAQADVASSYGPIKAALIHMAKGLARQYAKKKIRVNVVSPGTVYFKGGVWNMIEQNMPERYNDAMKRNPTGRMATPQEIASAAVFLASPVSGFTTGSNLVVDGAISNRVNF